MMWLALLAGFGMAFFLGKARWNYMRLPQVARAARFPGLDVTVVIPARNEVANIGRAVGSFAGTRVIVVDDGSLDSTAAAAREAGAEVIAAPALSGSWLGKPNACWAGARIATTEWLLFVDADTWYEPDFLGSLLEYARGGNLDGVSVFLRQVCRTWAEKAVLPYAMALYFAGVSARRVNDVHSPEALANGQCFLLRRDAYLALGGHASVADSLIEDVALARLAKRGGVRLHAVRAEELGSVRMYSGFREIWRGFEKNSFRFLQANPRSAWQVVVASVFLTSYLPVLAGLLADLRWIAAGAFVCLPSLLLWPWYGSLRRALLAPAGIYLFQSVALNAMLSTLSGRKAIWKERRVG